MNCQLQRMKADLKSLAAKIRENKKNGDRYSHYLEFRSKHIAYCLLRGTPMEKIESKHRDPKDGTHEYVRKEADRIIAKIKEGKLYGSEDIRPSGQTPVAVAASSSERTRPDTVRDRLLRFCRLA